ncbi:hypothetical protein DRB12_29555, partial [Klebsiella pneumoniae]
KGPAPNFLKTRDELFEISDITPMPGPLTKNRDFLPKFRQSLPYKLDISQNFNLHKNAFNIPNWQHAQYNFMQFTQMAFGLSIIPIQLPNHSNTNHD